MACDDQSGNELTESVLNVHKDNFFIAETMSDFFYKLCKRNNQELLIIHLNIRSMRKYWEELNVHMKDHIGVVDLLILTEIAIPEYENVVYKIDGYNCIFYNRENKKGGGIVIYVKSNIQFVVVKKGQNNTSMHEMIHVVLNMKGCIINILAVYRPPETSKNMFIDELEKYLNKISVKENIILIGDINIDTNKIYDNYKIKYEEILNIQGLEECIFSDTRVVIRDGVITRTKIDHIYARIKENLVTSVIEITISDHYAVAINMNINPGGKEVKILEKQIATELSNIREEILEHKQQKVRYNENNILSTLREIKWENEIEIDDSVEIYNFICNKFAKVYSHNRYTKCTPGKTRVNKCWITKDLIEQIKVRDKAFKTWKNTPTNMDYRDKYNTLRNNVNKKIKNQKTKFYSERIHTYKSNMKKLWNEINFIIGRKKVNNIDEIINNFLGKVYNSKEILSAFVNEFSHGIERATHTCNIKVGEEWIENEKDISIYIPKINESNVLNIIGKMKSSKSPGIDLIRIKDIKNCKTQIAPILVKFINISIQSGNMPQLLKTSIIRPIYKGGAHTEYTNYRPIAILPAIEKIMEAFISNKLNIYLRKYRIINEEQHGFQCGKSTISLLKNVTNYINNKLNTNKVIITIFIDLTKAFDLINHNILIKRLEAIGIRGKILDWFRNYLQERKIIVMIDQQYSELKETKIGIPQGSILGPILYTIYVNPVFKYIKHCKMYMYADDTALVIAHNDKNEAMKKLQEDFNTVQKWFHDNKLIINEKKTKLLCIRTPKRKLEPIYIQCHNNTCLHNGLRDNAVCLCSVLEEVTQFKYLGLYIDNKFSWDVQVEDVNKKLRACAAQFFKLKYILDYKNLKMVYCGLVQSVMKYGIQCYGVCSVFNKMKIERIHNRIVKIINDKNYTQDTTEILTFDGLYRYTMIIENYYNLGIRRRVQNEHNTRSKKYTVPFTYNKYGDRQLEVTIAKLFNSIPEDLLSLTKISVVKKEIKKWLMEVDNR